MTVHDAVDDATTTYLAASVRGARVPFEKRGVVDEGFDARTRAALGRRSALVGCGAA